MGATTNYQYDFDVTAVPEPASLSVLGFGAVGLLMRRSRRRA
jgi:PEP-CTERM motif